jgi:hypothetical protein
MSVAGWMDVAFRMKLFVERIRYVACELGNAESGRRWASDPEF